MERKRYYFNELKVKCWQSCKFFNDIETTTASEARYFCNIHYMQRCFSMPCKLHWALLITYFCFFMDIALEKHWMQPPECSVKKFVLRNFAKFTGKHLCQSHFFNKGVTEHLWTTACGLTLLRAHLHPPS